LIPFTDRDATGGEDSSVALDSYVFSPERLQPLDGSGYVVAELGPDRGLCSHTQEALRSPDGAGFTRLPGSESSMNGSTPFAR